MAITVKTAEPAKLLAAIYKAIDDKSVATWKYDSDKDFTHTTSTDQWLGKAYLRPIEDAENEELYFRIQILSKDYDKSTYTYGVYHGRFIQMLLAHFDKLFTSVSASALATVDDIIGKPAAP